MDASLADASRRRARRRRRDASGPGRPRRTLLDWYFDPPLCWDE
jgi:hypothetical protein